MEYVFGIDGMRETLKSKGESHTNLSGFNTIEREYFDQIIVDRFRVIAKRDSMEDSEGNCYDWYEIDCHNRMIDKFTPAKKDIDARIATLEQAIRDLSEKIDGGK